MQSWNCRRKLPNPRHPLEMAYCVLGHAARVSRNANELRLVAHAQDRAQLGKHFLRELIIGAIELLRLHRPTHERAEDDAIRRRPVGELPAQEGGREDSSAFDMRDYKSESIAGMVDVRQAVA